MKECVICHSTGQEMNYLRTGEYVCTNCINNLEEL